MVTFDLFLFCYAKEGRIFENINRDAATLKSFPAGNYMSKVNNRNTRARAEICSKLTIKITIKTPMASF